MEHNKRLKALNKEIAELTLLLDQLTLLSVGYQELMYLLGQMTDNMASHQHVDLTTESTNDPMGLDLFGKAQPSQSQSKAQLG